MQINFLTKLIACIKARAIVLSGHFLYYPYVWRYKYLWWDKFEHFPLVKLHVGCGKNRFAGWINADVTPSADLIIFLENRLPFSTESIKFIYSEHVVEHVAYKVGVSFFREAYRSLQSGGVIRIAMPDLDDLIDGYQKDWRRFDWISWPDFSFIQTRAEMLNIAFRWWGHQHLYNREELERALKEAGFKKIVFLHWHESNHVELRGLETRLDSKLIAEAMKD